MAPSECTTTNPTSSDLMLQPLTLLLSTIREYFLVTLTSTTFVTSTVHQINEHLLLPLGVPPKSLLTNEEFVLSSTAVVVTLFGYWIFFGKRHRRKRKELVQELRLAQRQVRLCVFVLCHWHVY